MSFPFIFEENFELGTKGNFTGTTVDTDSKLDFPHYSDIARVPGMPAPYAGANCMRVDLVGGTNDAYVLDDTVFDMALNEVQHWRFLLWVDPNLTMANTDEFIIFAARSAAAYEAAVVINFTTANGFRLGVGKIAGTSFLDLPLGRWVSVDLTIDLDAGGGNDGTLDLRLDGGAATQVTGLDQLAVTTGRMGAMDIDAGTTAGVILFDNILSDDARLYDPTDRFKEDVLLTASSHAFVGPGVILNASLLSGAGTDNVLLIYDTDVANTNDATNAVIEVKNTANNETVDPAGLPVRVRRGCYVSLTGTNPRAHIAFGGTPAFGSDGAIRSYGLRRKQQAV